jgi:hypothetical protein
MRVQQPVRDRDISLWQSAVHQTLSDRDDLSSEEKKRIEYGVSIHAQSEKKGGKPLDEPLPQAKTDGPPSTGHARNIAHGSRTAFHAIRAHQTGDSTDHRTLFSRLHDLVTRYSSWDIVGWVQCGWYYIKYYVVAHLPPTYRSWRGMVLSDDLGFSVIKYRLPSTCRVLLIGDWGTHMQDNVALLRQAVKKFKPQAIIHLGDVYYSGTIEECTENVINVLDRLYADNSRAARPPFFSVPGNHDYYSGGAGFYHTIDSVNISLPNCTQKGSFFCLRTEDDRWQFLGMDTGYNDRIPADQIVDTEGPDLHLDEMEWHKDKLENFTGSTILLSHHQLISAKEQLSRHGRPYLNEKLYGKFAPYFDRVSAWFWGHEHNLILFEDPMKFEADKPALRKPRLLGCSAYEESTGDDPFKIEYPQARFMEEMPRLRLSKFGDGQNFYNHAFAILDVAPDKIMASYYEYPSWGEASAPKTDPTIGEALFREDLMPARKP